MYHTVPTTVENIPPVTEDEVLDVVKESEITQSPAMIEYLIRHSCLIEGSFPTKWKSPKLVLMLKPGKLMGEPSF